jgi:hypothetical protein
MIVKIDRSTIKRNPDAGKDHFHVSGPWQGTFEIKGIYPDFIKDDDRFILRSWKPGKYYEGAMLSPDCLDVLMDPKNLKWFRDNKCEMSCSVDKNIQTYACRPQEEYGYRYENTPVTCGHCGEKIGVNELENDVADDGEGGEIYCAQVCPKCHHWDTFEKIEYENINEAIKDVVL